MMKKIIFFSLLALSSGIAPAIAQKAATAVPPRVFGVVTLEKGALSTNRLGTLMHNQQSVVAQLTGIAKEVCQKEGCWMKIGVAKRDDFDVLVKVKDHAFVLPQNITGRQVLVNGTVTQKTLSVAEQKHYLEDAGASREEIARVTAPKQVYEMQAAGVAIQ